MKRKEFEITTKQIIELLAPSDLILLTDLIQLTRTESERFIEALYNSPKANEKLKQLFDTHATK